MNSKQLEKIIIKLAEQSQQEFNYLEFKDKYSEYIEYGSDEIGKFIDHLIEKSERINLILLKHHINPEDFIQFVKDVHFPILLFYKKPEDGNIEPIVVFNDHKNKVHCYNFCTNEELSLGNIEFMLPNLLVYENAADINLNGKLIFINAFPVKYMMNDTFYQERHDKPLTPLQRLIRLLYGERKDILVIYIYALIVGIVNLSLPLGIQATISLISGGMVFSSVIVLISLVILGIIVSGGLQIMQMSLVEILQQRIFAKASFELVYRITKVRTEALLKYYPPELMNRFFDVVNLQKGLPKLFIEITGSLIQIFFGLLLMSFYHPYFLIFAIVLVTAVILVLYITSPRGLSASIMASKYKYKIAYWLQEVARTVDSFKLAGTTNMPIQKMDDYVNGYLYYRKSYFKVLLTQFINVVAFKTMVTGGLLILGTILVVDRQISLGQFVASEIIIILVVGSVEKLILNLDTIYSLLTAVDKISHITDLPSEKNTGLHVGLDQYETGLHIQAKNLKYKYKENNDYTLKDINFEIKPGERVCIVGANDSGKNTLMKVLTGVLDSYDGILTVNHLSLRDIHLGALRDKVDKNLTQDEIFYGSILDNITMGRSNVNYQDVIWAIESLGLADRVNSLEEGLYTIIGAGGKRLSGSMISKLILARSVVSRPKLLIVNDFSEHITRKEKLKILSFLQDKSNGWTLIILSSADDTRLMASSDSVILMRQGVVVGQGSYKVLLSDPEFKKIVMQT